LSQYTHISFEIYSDLFEIKFLDGKLSYRAREVKVSLFEIKSLDVKLSCRAKKKNSIHAIDR
jgi:hypothetical protein